MPDSDKTIAIIIGSSNGDTTLYQAFQTAIDLLYNEKKPIITGKQPPILFNVDESGVIASTWNKWGNDSRSREVVQKFHDLDAGAKAKKIYILENNYNNSINETNPMGLLTWYTMFSEKGVTLLRTQLKDVIEAVVGGTLSPSDESCESVQIDKGEAIKTKVEKSFEILMNTLAHQEGTGKSSQSGNGAQQ